MKGVSAWTASLRAARRSWTWSSARWRSADMEPGHSGSRGRGRRRAGGREIGNGKETEFWRRGEKKGEPGLGRVRWPQTWRGREKRGRTTTTKPNVREIYNQSKERRWKVREGRQEEEEEWAVENEWDKNNNGKMQERFPRPPPLPPHRAEATGPNEQLTRGLRTPRGPQVYQQLVWYQVWFLLLCTLCLRGHIRFDIIFLLLYEFIYYLRFCYIMMRQRSSFPNCSTCF